MATKNPRIVGYVSPKNHAHLKNFVDQQGLTESKAIDVIFSHFFSTASDPNSGNHSSTLKEVLNRIVATLSKPVDSVG